MITINPKPIAEIKTIREIEKGKDAKEIVSEALEISKKSQEISAQILEQAKTKEIQDSALVIEITTMIATQQETIAQAVVEITNMLAIGGIQNV